MYRNFARVGRWEQGSSVETEQFQASREERVEKVERKRGKSRVGNEGRLEEREGEKSEQVEEKRTSARGIASTTIPVILDCWRAVDSSSGDDDGTR